jgi:undecaprenyl diphosphate synthase
MDRLFRWFKKDSIIQEVPIDKENMPKHVAIIMDGNGRWARQNGMPRIAGHRAGMRNVKLITKAAGQLGIEALTLYAFSTENWKRPREEVDFIMKLPTEFFPLEIDELKANNVRIRMMGTMQGVPEHTQHAVNMAMAETQQNTGLILNIAMNYGGRSELILGIKQFTEDVMLGKQTIEQLSEQTFATYLQSQELPNLDLLIRTSGEIRISNFMLWQLAYTELWFTDVYWPEFTENHFYEAIRSYQTRARRYGKI